MLSRHNISKFYIKITHSTISDWVSSKSLSANGLSGTAVDDVAPSVVGAEGVAELSAGSEQCRTSAPSREAGRLSRASGSIEADWME